jgi:membrane-bound lytic murein transglycosylase D
MTSEAYQHDRKMKGPPLKSQRENQYALKYPGGRFGLHPALPGRKIPGRMARTQVIALALLVLGCASRESGVATYGPPPKVREPAPSASEEFALIGGDELTTEEQDLLATIHTATYDPPASATPPPLEGGLEELFTQESDALIHEKVGYDIPIVLNERVVWWIDYFANRVPATFERYLIRSGAWLPYLKRRLRESGLPEDLVYLALIESGFSTQAVSHAGAVGPWQFMPYTGREYGLRIDGWVDERRDYDASTEAAIAYLSDLHAMFGSWYLAAAGYNGGQGRVGRSMLNDNTVNFWELTGIHDETKNYVPKLIAATIIAKEPEKYGFYDIPYLEEVEWETVTVPTTTDLEVIAESAETPLETIRALNAHLLRGRTPPGESNFPVKVPKGKSDDFNDNYYDLPPDQRTRTPIVHVVRRGETLGAIADAYGVDAEDLIEENGLRNPSRLRAGQRLTIPRQPRGNQPPTASPPLETPARGDGIQIAAGEVSRRATEAAPTSREPVLHVVQPGENLSMIARRYDVAVLEIKRLNGLRSDTIQAGQTLRIPS